MVFFNVVLALCFGYALGVAVIRLSEMKAEKVKVKKHNKRNDLS